MGQTLDQSSTHRIGGDRDDDGNCSCCLLGGLRRRRIHRDNDIRVEADKLCGKRRETLRLPLRVSVLDADVPSLDPSEVHKTLPKRVELRRHGGVSFTRKKADEADLSRLLLRTCRERPRRRAAEECDEATSSHANCPSGKTYQERNCASQ